MSLSVVASAGVIDKSVRMPGRMVVATRSYDRAVAGLQNGPRDPRRKAEMAMPIAVGVTVHPGSVTVQQRTGV